MAPVNGFGSDSFMDIAMCVGRSSYSGLWDGPGTSYYSVAGVVSISCCIMAASCIRTLLGAIFIKKMNKLSKKKQIKVKNNKKKLFQIVFFSLDRVSSRNQ